MQPGGFDVAGLMVLGSSFDSAQRRHGKWNLHYKSFALWLDIVTYNMSTQSICPLGGDNNTWFLMVG